MEFKNPNEHKAAIANAFLDLFKHQSQCDVSLVIAGRMMKAHKRILSTFSTFFKEIFDELEANSSIATNLGANVAFLNYKYEHVEVLIKYMYTGVIRVNKDEWPMVLKCATDLGITAIIEFGKQQQESTANDTAVAAAAVEKRKLEDSGKSNAVEVKRSKNDAPKESVTISDAKRKESQSSSSSKQQRDSEAEEILSGVSFDHSSRRNEKSNSTHSISSAKTQITKMSKPVRISEVSKESSSKSDSKSSNDARKDTNSFSSQKLLPTAASTPRSNSISSDLTMKSSTLQADDSDDSMDNSPFNKTKRFSEKLKELPTMTDTSKSDKKDNKEQARPNSTNRNEDNTSTKPSTNVIKTTTCGKCGKTYTGGTHLKESELPTPPAMCPIQGCDKMMRMNRQLKDHLTKIHKVSLCEEK